MKQYEFWFVVGSLVALIAGVLGAAFWLQLLLFALVALALLLLLRPFLQRFVTPHKVPTNIDAMVGQEAVVTEAISKLDETGSVKINGLVWSARSESGEPIPAGALVTVQAVEGVRLSSCAGNLDKENSLDAPALFQPAPFTFEGEGKCISATAPAYSFSIFILEK